MENELFYLVTVHTGWFKGVFTGTLEECKMEQKVYCVPTVILKENDLTELSQFHNREIEIVK